MKEGASSKEEHPPIYVISGGDGSSGEMLLRTALAQFPDTAAAIVTVPHVRSERQLQAALNRAKRDGATVFHTLVDAGLRRKLLSLAREQNVIQIDLMGRVMNRLASFLGARPIGQPGLYRQSREEYLERIEAIEFTVQHDDGQRPEDLPDADVVLVGPSRVGKTPLSIYLSTLGWKVANIPFVQGIPLPESLSKIDRKCVVGVVVDPSRLRQVRATRGSKLRLDGEGAYLGRREVRDEVEASKRAFRQLRIAVLDATDKPIEETAEDVIAIVGKAR